MEKVFDFLRTNHLCTVATASDNRPRASVLEYYMVGDSVIFATSPGSIKACNLSKNNRISVSVHAMPRFVTLDGCVSEPTAEEIAGYNSQLFAHHPEFVAMIEGGLMEPFVYYKINCDKAYYNDYSAGMVPTEIIQM